MFFAMFETEENCCSETILCVLFKKLKKLVFRRNMFLTKGLVVLERFSRIEFYFFLEYSEIHFYRTRQNNDTIIEIY